MFAKIMITVKGWFHWINIQIEWAKSFIQEPQTPLMVTPKASSKRLISISVVAAFLFSYVKVSIATKTIQDIPQMWFLTIASILGLNILDWYIKGNGNKTGDNK